MPTDDITLDTHLTPLGLEPSQLTGLNTHYRHLTAWKARVNLTAIHKPADIARTLYAESIVLARTIPQSTATILDVGSGAGFPGIAIAICHPTAQVTLVEADLKKSIFLQESTAHLPNVTVLRKRIETVTGHWAFLTSRAVAWSEITAAAARLADHAALLTSSTQLASLIRDTSWAWDTPRPIPWNPAHVTIHAQRRLIQP